MARGIRCDYRQLRDLQRRLQRLSDGDMDAFCHRTANELAARLLRKVRERTPVDTGTLRRGWDVGEIRKNGDTYEIEVINPTEYGPYVEYGHRTANHRGWVRGRFMLKMSEQDLEQMAPALIQQRLYLFLKEALGW